MRSLNLVSVLGSLSIPVLVQATVSRQPYTWKNVKIGGGGGFVPGRPCSRTPQQSHIFTESVWVLGIVFNPSEKGLAYARTDIGGVYKLNSVDDTW